MREQQLLSLLGFSVPELSEDINSLLRCHLGELVEIVAHYRDPFIARGKSRCASAKTLLITLDFHPFSEMVRCNVSFISNARTDKVRF